MEFKIGQTVQLKSGGAVMTVEGVFGDLIECVWFSNDGHVLRDRFDIKTLTTDGV